MPPTPQWDVTTNEEFVSELCDRGYIRDDGVKDAFLKVDRAHYAPKEPYVNAPVSLGFWSVISMPVLNTSAIETTRHHLVPTESSPKRHVLDVGSGSGYTTHLLAEMVGPDGIVVAIENIKQLRDMGERNMRKTTRGRELLESNVIFVLGDGRDGLHCDLRADIPGVDADTKWDVIHAAAAANFEVPSALMDQLKAPGCMFIPITEVMDDGWNTDVVWKIEKNRHGKITREVVHPRATYVKLQQPPNDTEAEMNRPGYGMFDNE